MDETEAKAAAEQLLAEHQLAMSAKRVRHVRVLVFEGSPEALVLQLAKSKSPGLHSLRCGAVTMRVVGSPLEVLDDEDEVFCGCGSNDTECIDSVGTMQCHACNETFTHPDHR